MFWTSCFRFLCFYLAKQIVGRLAISFFFSKGRNQILLLDLVFFSYFLADSLCCQSWEWKDSTKNFSQGYLSISLFCFYSSSFLYVREFYLFRSEEYKIKKYFKFIILGIHFVHISPLCFETQRAGLICDVLSVSLFLSNSSVEKR